MNFSMCWWKVSSWVVNYVLLITQHLWLFFSLINSPIRFYNVINLANRIIINPDTTINPCKCIGIGSEEVSDLSGKRSLKYHNLIIILWKSWSLFIYYSFCCCASATARDPFCPPPILPILLRLWSVPCVPPPALCNWGLLPTAAAVSKIQDRDQPLFCINRACHTMSCGATIWHALL